MTTKNDIVSGIIALILISTVITGIAITLYTYYMGLYYLIEIVNETHPFKYNLNKFSKKGWNHTQASITMIFTIIMIALKGGDPSE